MSMWKQAWGAAVSAAAIAMVAMPSWAADWTDANGVAYTALKSINGGGSGTTAGGFIITDITPAGTETVKFKVKTPAAVSENGCVYCARSFTKSGTKWSKTPDPTQFTGFRLGANFRIDRMGTQTSLTGVTCAPSTEYSASADYTTGDVTVNSAVQSQNLGTGSYTPGGKLSILASYSNIAAPASPTASSTWGNYLPDDLYYLQLWSAAGVLVHNFMPASRDSDSAVGLYDTVTRTFHAAAKNTITGAAKSAVTGSPVKWTGAGDGVTMSSGANWEGDNAPQEGDDLDFTIAVPNAEINADIGATFGKLWLGDGDGPVFTGSLSVTSVNDSTKIHGAVTIVAYYNWNGNGSNWSDAGAWTFDNAPTAWSDGVNAVFDIANASATLTADASANTVSFNQPATIAGSSTLTVPTVSVASDVSAVISAPTAGALEKTGAGTLTLGSSRTDATTVTEGTLKMLNGATVSGLTLGTDDPTKPVVFDYGGQTLTAAPETYLVTGSDVTLTNGNFYTDGMLAIRDSTKLPSVLTIAKGVDLYKYGAGQLVFDAQGEATVNVVGGTVRQTGQHRLYIQSASTNGTLRINVTDGGLLASSLAVLAMCCPGNFAYYNPSLYMVFNDSTFRVRSGYSDLDIFLGCPDSSTTETYRPINPTGVIAATNSVFDVGRGIYIGRSTTSAETAGSYTADFENCVITAKTFAVNYDRPLNNARFNGTRFVFGAADGSIDANDGADNWFTIGTDGLTIDTQAYSATLNANLGGSGVITKVGAGTLVIQSNQTASAALNVNEGTLELIAGLSVARPISVASGAVLKFQDEASLASLALAAGSTNDVTVSPVTLSGGLTLPESGAAALTFNGGAFPVGIYRLFAYPGVAEADGAKFAPDTNGETATWSVVNGALTLTVGNPPNTWIGGTTGSLSDQSNWSRGTVPVRGDTAVVAVGSAATLTVGASFSPDVIVIPDWSADVTFSGETAITGLAAVTNLSGSVCTFEVPVVFANEINVYQTAYYYSNSSGDHKLEEGGHVRFAGGVTGTSFAEGTTRRLDGTYTIPATAGWVANNASENLWTLPGGDTGSSLTITGSSYEVPGATDTSMLLMGGDCAFTTGVVRTSNRLSYRSWGEYVVTDELEVAMKGDVYIAQAAGGTYKVEKLTLSDNGTGWNFYVANSTRANHTKSLYIGEGGLNVNGTKGKSTALVLGYDNKTSHDVTHLYPWHSDYAINGKGGSTRDFLIYRDTFIHTDDENGVARTVTLNGIADVRAALTIDGSGRFQVNSNGMNGENPPRLGDTTVTDSATLAYASGADLGAGAVTVSSNATMEVASGVNTFNGLTLDDGATLAFNFTEKKVAPQIAIADGKTLTVEGAVKVKISSTVIKPKGGTYVLTSCGGFDAEDVTVQLAADAPQWVKSLSVNDDGNLELAVKRNGFTLIVK